MAECPMLHTTTGLKSFYAHTTRSLDQAVQAACAISAAEQLPITATTRSDPGPWHRDAIVKTVPVYGYCGGHKALVPATARIDGDRAIDGAREWSQLTVEAKDFKRYLDWLHSIW